MVYPINKTKEDFRNKFIEKVKDFDYGSFVSDADILLFVTKNHFNLSVKEIQACIRDIEDKIGVLHRKRLKRVRNEGYLVLEPKAQVDTALREGKHKVKTALKKTSERLGAVNVDTFTAEQRRELLSRTSAIDSLLDIVNNSTVHKKIFNRREVEILSNTATQTKQIKRREEA